MCSVNVSASTIIIRVVNKITIWSVGLSYSPPPRPDCALFLLGSCPTSDSNPTISTRTSSLNTTGSSFKPSPDSQSQSPYSQTNTFS